MANLFDETKKKRQLTQAQQEYVKQLEQRYGVTQQEEQDTPLLAPMLSDEETLRNIQLQNEIDKANGKNPKQYNWWEKFVIGTSEFTDTVDKVALDVFEGIGDAVLGLGAMVGSWFGANTKGLENAIEYDWSQKLIESDFFKVAKKMQNPLGLTVSDDAWKTAHNGQTEVLPEILENVASIGGSLAGNAILAVGTAGLGNAVGLGAKGIQVASLGGQFVSSQGIGLEQGLQEGYDLDQAQAYGLISGAGEVVAQKLTGGILKRLGLTSGKIANVVSHGKSNPSIGSGVIANIFRDMNEEGIEEVVTSLIEPINRMFTLEEGKNASLERYKELFQENGGFEGLLMDYMGGALGAGVMSGIGTYTNVRKHGYKGYGLSLETKEIADINKEIAEAQKNGDQKKVDSLLERKKKVDERIQKKFGSYLEEMEKKRLEREERLKEKREILKNEASTDEQISGAYEEILNDMVDEELNPYRYYLENASNDEKTFLKAGIDKIENRLGYSIEFNDEMDSHIDLKNKIISVSKKDASFKTIGKILAHEWSHAISTKELNQAILESVPKEEIDNLLKLKQDSPKYQELARRRYADELEMIMNEYDGDESNRQQYEKEIVNALAQDYFMDEVTADLMTKLLDGDDSLKGFEKMLDTYSSKGLKRLLTNFNLLMKGKNVKGLTKFRNLIQEGIKDNRKNPKQDIRFKVDDDTPKEEKVQSKAEEKPQNVQSDEKQAIRKSFVETSAKRLNVKKSMDLGDGFNKSTYNRRGEGAKSQWFNDMFNKVMQIEKSDYFKQLDAIKTYEELLEFTNIKNSNYEFDGDLEALIKDIKDDIKAQLINELKAIDNEEFSKMIKKKVDEKNAKTFEVRINELSQEIGKLLVEKSVSDERLKKATDRIINLSIKYSKLEAEIEANKKMSKLEIEDLQDEYSSVRKSLESQIKGLQEDYFDLMKEHNKQSKQFDQYIQETIALRDKIEATQLDLEATRKELHDAQVKNGRLERKVISRENKLALEHQQLVDERKKTSLQETIIKNAQEKIETMKRNELAYKKSDKATQKISDAVVNRLHEAYKALATFSNYGSDFELSIDNLETLVDALKKGDLAKASQIHNTIILEMLEKGNFDSDSASSEIALDYFESYHNEIMDAFIELTSSDNYTQLAKVMVQLETQKQLTMNEKTKRFVDRKVNVLKNTLNRMTNKIKKANYRGVDVDFVDLTLNVLEGIKDTNIRKIEDLKAFITGYIEPIFDYNETLKKLDSHYEVLSVDQDLLALINEFKNMPNDTEITIAMLDDLNKLFNGAKKYIESVTGIHMVDVAGEKVEAREFAMSVSDEQKDLVKRLKAKGVKDDTLPWVIKSWARPRDIFNYLGGMNENSQIFKGINNALEYGTRRYQDVMIGFNTEKEKFLSDKKNKKAYNEILKDKRNEKFVVTVYQEGKSTDVTIEMSVAEAINLFLTSKDAYGLDSLAQEGFYIGKNKYKLYNESADLIKDKISEVIGKQSRESITSHFADRKKQRDADIKEALKNKNYEVWWLKAQNKGEIKAYTKDNPVPRNLITNTPKIYDDLLKMQMTLDEQIKLVEENYDKRIEEIKAEYEAEVESYKENLKEEEKALREDYREVASEHVVNLQEQIAQRFDLNGDSGYANYIKYVMNFFNTSRELKYKTDRAVKGFSNVRGSDYHPISVDSSQLDADFSLDQLVNGSLGAFNPSFNISRTKARALRITSEAKVIARYTQEISMYYGFAEQVKNINLMFNYRDSEGQNLNAILTDRFKEGDAQYITNYIRNLLRDIHGYKQPTNATDTLAGKMINKLRSSFAQFQLGFGVKVMFTQTASLGAATKYLSFASIGKGFKPKDSFKAIDKPTVLRYRKIAGTIIERHTNGVIDKANGVATKGIGFFDSWTIEKLWYASLSHVENEMNVDFDTLSGEARDSFIKKATKLFEKVVNETQPNYDALFRSEIMRSKRDFVNMLMMFKTQQSQMMGNVLEVFLYERARKTFGTQYDRNKVIGGAVKSLVWGALMYSVMSWLFNKILNGDWGEEPEEAMLSITEDTLNGMTTSIIPIVSNFLKIDFEKGISINEISMGYFESINEMITRINDGGNVSPKELVDSVGLLTGVPTRNLYKILRGVMQYVSPDASAEMNLLYTKGLSADKRATRTNIDFLLVDNKVSQARAYFKNYQNSVIQLDYKTNNELFKLYAEGYTSVILKDVPQSISANGVKIDVDPVKFKAIYSKASPILNEIQKSASFRGLDKASKEAVIQMVISKYHTLAKNVLRGSKLSLLEKLMLSNYPMSLDLFTQLYQINEIEEELAPKEIQKRISSLRGTKGNKYLLYALTGNKLSTRDTNILKNHLKQHLSKKEIDILLG